MDGCSFLDRREGDGWRQRKSHQLSNAEHQILLSSWSSSQAEYEEDKEETSVSKVSCLRQTSCLRLHRDGVSDKREGETRKHAVQTGKAQ